LSFPARHLTLLFFAAIFVALATVAIEKPGYSHEEVIFVPASLRVLGDCGVDADLTKSMGCYPLLHAPGYVGAVKAWLHAPVFALFGVNVWTVRLPSILIGLSALLVLWSFARHELGTMWASILLALLVTDPLLLNHARLDFGPHMIALLMRVLSLAALWRWIQTGRMHWLLILCAAFLTGFADKRNFVWVIGAWLAAAALVAGGTGLRHLRAGTPWQPLVAGITLVLLTWGVVTLVPQAIALASPGEPEALSIPAQLAKVWNLHAATFSGMSVINMVFGAGVPVTAAFNLLLLAQLAAALLLLARRRPWTPAWRLLAFLTAAMVLLLVAITATPQVHGSHHLVMLWPLPTLHLVTLIAICAQHAGNARRVGRMPVRTAVALIGAIAWGTLLAWHLAMDFHYIDAWRNDRNFRPLFDPVIATLSKRVQALDADRVISVDRGLHAPLVTLANRDRAPALRDWTQLLEAPALDGELRAQVARHLAGKRVAFVLRAPPSDDTTNAQRSLAALLGRTGPCRVTEESPVSVAGKPLYLIVVADYLSCAPTPTAPG
jgi:hypothetical protein